MLVTGGGIWKPVSLSGNTEGGECSDISGQKSNKKVPDTASEHPAESRRESRPFGGHTKGQEAAAAEEEVGQNTTQKKCNN